MPHIRTLAAIVLAAAAAPCRIAAADWPMYRGDAARSAATSDGLADRLYLQWTWTLPARQAAFATDRRNLVDEISAPVIAGGLVLIANEHDRSLLALDLGSGELRWRFVADAPFRFAPAVADGVVFAAADDGNLYALDLASGAERWRYAGAPTPRKIVNHLHIGSAWPASGGPAVRDGVVYFSTGIMPIDGTWMHAVDARTGQRRWRTPAQVCWGYAAVVGDWVAVPSGMFPNTFDAATGAVRRNGFWGAKNLSPNRIAGFTADWIWNGNEIHPLGPGRAPFAAQYLNAEHGANMWSPVIDGDRAYGINDGILRGMRLPRPGEAISPAGGKAGRRALAQVLGDWWIHARPNLPWNQVGEPLALPEGADLPDERIAPPTGAVGIGWAGAAAAAAAGNRPWFPRRLELKAGPMLVAGGPGRAVGIALGAEGAPPRVAWVLPVPGRRQEMAAADGRLVVVGDDGGIACFGPQPAAARSWSPPAPAAPAPAAAATAAAILAAAGPSAAEGYAIVVGDPDGSLAEALAAGSRATVNVLVPERARSLAVRARLAAAGRLGRNLGVIEGGLAAAQLPPYACNLLAVAADAGRVVGDPPALAAAYAALRPFGGAACFALDAEGHAALAAAAAGFAGAELRRAGGWSLLVRRGALPGSDDWTHERHGVGNTLRSADTAIDAPMGMLWFGGPSAQWQTRIVCDGLAQSVEVVDGRYIMLGRGLVSAIDAYTGRLLWETAVPTAQRYVSYIEALQGPDGKPAYPEPDAGRWQGNHAGLAPGDIEVARQCGDGFNMVSVADGIYLTVAEELWELSPADGRVLRKLAMPVRDPAARRPLCWGSVRIVGDAILATAFDPARWRELFPVWAQGNEKNKQRLPAGWLFAADRRTGALRWQVQAGQGFQSWGVACGNGRVFALDQLTPEVIAKGGEAGRPPAGTVPAVAAFDLADGRELWRRSMGVLAMDIAYAAERDLLVLPSRDGTAWRDGGWAVPPPAASRQAAAPTGEMTALRGSDGTPAWRIGGDEFAEPVVVNGDLVITRRGRGYDLRTGARAVRTDPVTGIAEPVDVSTGGCNFLVASPQFTTRRTAYDTWSAGCTVHFAGIRSGCTPSMLPAAGLISIINQAMEENTELRSNGAMVSRPDNVNWTAFSSAAGSAMAALAELPAPLPRIALDLGAPGDHLDRDGRPWLRLASERPAPAKAKSGAAPAIELARWSGDGIASFILPVPGLAIRDGGQAAVAATGWEGLAEIAIRLVPPGQPAQRYRVRLHFLEPDPAAVAGSRVIAVSVQGREAIAALDIAAEAGPLTALAREIADVEVAGDLVVGLRASAGRSVLCGIEAIAAGGP